MFAQYGTLKDFVPVIEVLTRMPGKLMGRGLALLSAVVALMGWFVGRGGGGFLEWIPFGVGIIGLAVALFFMWRRYRLENAVTEWVSAETSTLSGEGSSTTTDYGPMFDGAPSSSEEVAIIDQDGTPLGSNSRATPAQDSAAQRNYDAMMEQTQLRDTWMPRVEAAQRGAIAAAGGTVNAPYLKDDLRVTLVSAMTAGVLIPIELLVGFIAFFALF